MKQNFNITSSLVSLRRKFWQPLRQMDGQVFRSFNESSIRAEYLVKFYYIINLFIWIIQLRNWEEFRASIVLDPSWPLFWLQEGDSSGLLTQWLFAINIVCAVLVVLKTEYRSLRILNFLSVFMLSAAFNSDVSGWEKMTESFNYNVFSFLFIFLDYKVVRHRRQSWNFCFIVSICQILTLLSYVHAAIWRIRISIQDWIAGNQAVLDWDGLGRAIKAMHYMTGSAGPLAQKILSVPILSGAGLIFATLFELVLLYFLFKPKYYRILGLELVCLHLGFVMLFNFAFNEHLLLTALFLAGSPFVKQKLKSA